MEKNIMRGELYYADLDPIIGSEQGGYRPVLIIQNNTGNKHSPTVIVAAITSKAGVKAKLPTHYFLEPGNGLEKTSLVLLEQLRTVDKQRLTEYVGTLPDNHIRGINHALAVSIGLNSNFTTPLLMTLCPTCASQFYNSPEHIIKRSDMAQTQKETCMFCNARQGYDFEIVRKGGNQNV